jgi:hypothetical protein
MHEPNVDLAEDIEWELVSSSREMSTGFVAFGSLDPSRTVREVAGRLSGSAKPVGGGHSPITPGPSILSGPAHPRR